MQKIWRICLKLAFLNFETYLWSYVKNSKENNAEQVDYNIDRLSRKLDSDLHLFIFYFCCWILHLCQAFFHKVLVHGGNKEKFNSQFKLLFTTIKLNSKKELRNKIKNYSQNSKAEKSNRGLIITQTLDLEFTQWVMTCFPNLYGT